MKDNDTGECQVFVSRMGIGQQPRRAASVLRRAALLLATLLPAIVAAETARVPMQVSAYVPSRVSIETLDEPLSSVTIGEADVAAGFKDVTAAYRVRSNDPAGYLLRFAARAGLTDSVLVTGLAEAVLLGDLGAEVLQRPRASVQDYRLRFRLNLAATARPGTYAVPVVVGVATL